jgi:predicted SprT family Zn-dependent metalloprotease
VTAPLNLETLRAELRARGFTPARTFHGEAPFVGRVDSDDSEDVGGRYFPSRNAILIYRHGDRRITEATLNHELAHWMQYKSRCGGSSTGHRRKCGYVGQHDEKFYEVLEALHRKSGIPPKVARIPEGKYSYPKRWDRDDAW